MRSAAHVAARELRLGFRNPWAYSFMALFCLFSLSLLLLPADRLEEGYSAAAGSLLNLMLYLLPLMTLLIGSFSLASEKEDGSWDLLATYPLGTFAFLAGKMAGLAAVLLTVVAFGFGLTGVLGALAGKAPDAGVLGMFFVFAAGLILLFLAAAAVIGTAAQSRWQALTVSVAVWFFFVIAWPTLLIAGLGLLPHPWIKPALAALTALNPAELVRLFVVVKLGGGSVFGPEYYAWMNWIRGSGGTAGFLAICLVWIAAALAFSHFVWERRRTHG
ncbi:MAG TPA: ABC transporter permease [Paenibacillaceae bacterium]